MWLVLRHIGLGRVFLRMWIGLLLVCAFGNGGVYVFDLGLLLFGCWLNELFQRIVEKKSRSEWMSLRNP